jgi:hypothetical protein
VSDLHEKMRAKTPQHQAQSNLILAKAFDIAREKIPDSLLRLYDRIKKEAPVMPEVSVSEEIAFNGLPSLHIVFHRIDKERKLSFIPLKILEPREPFHTIGAVETTMTFAVFVLKIESNARGDPDGSLYLEIETPNDILDLDHFELAWKVNLLVGEAHPPVDRNLIRRIIERAFVED